MSEPGREFQQQQQQQPIVWRPVCGAANRERRSYAHKPTNAPEQIDKCTPYHTHIEQCEQCSLNIEQCCVHVYACGYWHFRWHLTRRAHRVQRTSSSSSGSASTAVTERTRHTVTGCCGHCCCCCCRTSNRHNTLRLRLRSYDERRAGRSARDAPRACQAAQQRVLRAESASMHNAHHSNKLTGTPPETTISPAHLNGSQHNV